MKIKSMTEASEILREFHSEKCASFIGNRKLMKPMMKGGQKIKIW